MEYRKISQIPKNAECVFRIANNISSIFIAGNPRACIRLINDKYNNNYEVHEVVLEGHKCKIFFDIEQKVAIDDKESNECNLEKILKIIINTFDIFTIARIPQKTPSMNDLIVGDASRIVETNDGIYYKFSYHVVVKHLMLAEILDVKLFAILVCDKLKVIELSNWIDISVYRKNANFRTMTTPKNGISSSKFRTDNYISWESNFEESFDDD